MDAKGPSSSPSHTQKLLRPADLPDNFTRSLYKIAPYKGCGHGCRYCDGRAERYYVEGDFEKDVEIRHTIPDRLAVELPGLRERGMIAFGSGVTDPYQPLEAIHELTGRCAKILASAQTPMPALVMTKSSLAMRDLNEWKEVQQRAGFLLLLSLTSLDESVREEMEPHASSFRSRLEMIRAFKKAGCSVGVLAMPFLPGISDNIDSIRRLYSACADAEADFIMPGGLTLRPGRQKEHYMEKLRSYRPDLLQYTLDLYREERLSGAPTSDAMHVLASRISTVQREFEIPNLLPHHCFARLLPRYDSLRVLFRDMIELYKERGINTSALVRSARSYDVWLISLRRAFRRKRALPKDWLETRFADAVADGELVRVLQNNRLAHFATAILQKDMYFNYQTLKLTDN